MDDPLYAIRQGQKVNLAIKGALSHYVRHNNQVTTLANSKYPQKVIMNLIQRQHFLLLLKCERRLKIIKRGGHPHWVAVDPSPFSYRHSLLQRRASFTLVSLNKQKKTCWCDCVIVSARGCSRLWVLKEKGRVETRQCFFLRADCST